MSEFDDAAVDSASLIMREERTKTSPTISKETECLLPPTISPGNPLCPSALRNGLCPPVDFVIQRHHNGCPAVALHISDGPEGLSGEAARTHIPTVAASGGGGDVAQLIPLAAPV